jgi:zinc finger SWIM domain-containing protein 3
MSWKRRRGRRRRRRKEEEREEGKCVTRVDIENFKPCIGMEFGTSEEAYNFYNTYGGHAGFSVRKNSMIKSRKDVSSVRFVCSKEGLSRRQKAELKELGSPTILRTPEREHGSTRTNCKASLRVKLVKKIWKVSVFMDEHNHDLVCSPSKKRNLRSQKRISKEDKQIILDLHAQSVGVSKILEYIAKKNGGKRNLFFKKKDVSNQISDAVSDEISDEISDEEN